MPKTFEFEDFIKHLAAKKPVLLHTWITITDVQPDKLEQLLEYPLPNNLYLCFDYLELEGMVTITTLLSNPECPRNLRLNLSEASIGHEGMNYFLENVKWQHCPSGLWLDLSRNNLSLSNAKGLADALQKNQFPPDSHLNVTENNMSLAGLALIIDALAHNTTLRSIKLGEITPKLLIKLNKALKTNDTLLEVSYTCEGFPKTKQNIRNKLRYNGLNQISHPGNYANLGKELESTLGIRTLAGSLLEFLVTPNDLDIITKQAKAALSKCDFKTFLEIVEINPTILLRKTLNRTLLQDAQAFFKTPSSAKLFPSHEEIFKKKVMSLLKISETDPKQDSKTTKAQFKR